MLQRASILRLDVIGALDMFVGNDGTVLLLRFAA